MVKIKTSELTGPALRWAVATIEFDAGNICIKNIPPGHPYVLVFYGVDRGKGGAEFAPDIDWSQGGPIIEREWLCVDRLLSGQWLAAKRNNDGDTMLFAQSGPTPLIAAMRCFVASKSGDEVEVPDELVQ